MPHGKISVKELVGQGMGASSIEVTDNNIKSFERVAKKYNVQFAVKKDKTEKPLGEVHKDKFLFVNIPRLCLELFGD